MSMVVFHDQDGNEIHFNVEQFDKVESEVSSEFSSVVYLNNGQMYFVKENEKQVNYIVEQALRFSDSRITAAKGY